MTERSDRYPGKGRQQGGCGAGSHGNFREQWYHRGLQICSRAQQADSGGL